MLDALARAPVRSLGGRLGCLAVRRGRIGAGGGVVRRPATIGIVRTVRRLAPGAIGGVRGLGFDRRRFLEVRLLRSQIDRVVDRLGRFARGIRLHLACGIPVRGVGIRRIGTVALGAFRHDRGRVGQRRAFRDRVDRIVDRFGRFGRGRVRRFGGGAFPSIFPGCLAPGIAGGGQVGDATLHRGGHGALVAHVVGQHLLQAGAEIVGVLRVGLEQLVAIATAAHEVVGDDPVDALGVDGLAAHHHVRDAAARLGGGIEAVGHARHLREAAAALLDLAGPVLQARHDVRTLEAEGGERVLKRQDRQHLAHGHLAFVDGGAQAPAVLDGDLDALIAHPVQHGVGDEVAHGALARAARGAVAVDGGGGLAHDHRLEILDRAEHLLDARVEVLVLFHGGVDQDGVARQADEIAPLVEGQHHLTEIFRVGIGLHDGRVVHHHGIGLGARFLAGLVVEHQRVRVPADDEVDIGDGRGDLAVTRQADMGDGDDLVDALALHVLHRLAQRGHVVGERDVRTRRRGFARVARNRAHEAHALAANIGDHVGVDPVRDARQVLRFDVGAQNGKRHAVEKRAQLVRSAIELVIAERQEVDAQGGRHLRLPLAAIGGVEQRALEMVSRRDHQRRPLQGLASLLDQRLEPREATEALARLVVLGRAGGVEPVDRLDACVRIVEVQDVEAELGQGGAGGEPPERRAQRERERQAQQRTGGCGGPARCEHGRIGSRQGRAASRRGD